MRSASSSVPVSKSERGSTLNLRRVDFLDLRTGFFLEFSLASVARYRVFEVISGIKSGPDRGKSPSPSEEKASVWESSASVSVSVSYFTSESASSLCGSSPCSSSSPSPVAGPSPSASSSATLFISSSYPASEKSGEEDFIPEASFSGASFSGASFSGVNFPGASSIRELFSGESSERNST
ncbi:pentapeptide repeat-containing protein [Methanosarcina acetivorans]|uniref:pentapeptide repeat-containing protein n=1 Tax=Methanosarcina acetivorans TaxID=2214 RepID=UPI001D0509A2